MARRSPFLTGHFLTGHFLTGHLHPRQIGLILAGLFGLALVGCGPDADQRLPPPGRPPFRGTVWIDADVIRPSDPTSFRGLTAKGRGERSMYDRRAADFVTYEAHLFYARFGRSTGVEVQVNPEFSAEAAETNAAYYAEVIGRIPGFLFTNLQTVWIHRGEEPFGGGNDNILIHTGRQFEQAFLEEILVHEGGHTSMDPFHRDAPGWRAAQRADPVAISSYAAEFPDREDIAETLLPYLALRFRSERLDPGVVTEITRAIPNRIDYLDGLGLDMRILE